MAQSKIHEIRNRITALESQIYMLKRSIEDKNGKHTMYMERMKSTLQDLEKELVDFHDVTKTSD